MKIYLTDTNEYKFFGLYENGEEVDADEYFDANTMPEEMTAEDFEDFVTGCRLDIEKQNDSCGTSYEIVVK